MNLFDIKNSNKALTNHPVLWASDWHRIPQYAIVYIFLISLVSILFTSVSSIDNMIYFIENFHSILTLIVLIFIGFFFKYKLLKKFVTKGLYNVCVQYLGIILPIFLFASISFCSVFCVLFKLNGIINPHDLKFYEKYSENSISDLKTVKLISKSDTLARLKKIFPLIKFDTIPEPVYDENNNIESNKFYYKLSASENWHRLNFINRIINDPWLGILNIGHYVYILIPLFFFISNLVYVYYYQNINTIISVTLYSLLFLFSFATMSEIIKTWSIELIYLTFGVPFLIFISLLVNGKYYYYFKSIFIYFYITHPFWISPILTILTFKFAELKFIYITIASCLFFSLYGAIKFSKYYFLPKPM